MLKVGIVGLPNVGKSTLFNAVLKRQVALVANYPFATIDANVGVAEVIDDRLEKLAEIIQKNEGKNPPKVYSTIEFVDIAGLVEGANKGEGLGNKFLANIRGVDLILQVVRDFKDPNIIREHSKDPDTDIHIINNELILKDLETLEKQLRIDKKGEANLILQKYYDALNKGELAYNLRKTTDDNHYLEFIKPLFLLTDKPVVYVFNVDENDVRIKKNSIFEYNGCSAIYICAKLENELASLSTADQKEYLAQLEIEKGGFEKVAQICFSKLGLISFLTAGVIEVRAWEIPQGANAQKASGRIHTDFEHNFIKAEIIPFADFVQYGGRLGAKEHGKMRLEGKEYIMKDGDVVEFKIGASK